MQHQCRSSPGRGCVPEDALLMVRHNNSSTSDTWVPPVLAGNQVTDTWVLLTKGHHEPTGLLNLTANLRVSSVLYFPLLDELSHWNPTFWTSLVVQWLRIRLPMQGTWVQALVWEDPTYCGATKPVCHNYWACALEPVSHNYWARAPRARAPQQEKPLQWEACSPQQRVAPTSHN